jgi:small subunit ribosomal protein S16
MVVIRLARFGSTHRPKYRVTVADSRCPLKGKYIEILGHFNPEPRGKDQGIILDLAKVDSWIKKGAQPTDRVKKVIAQARAQAS